jgi:hypothetical protein
MSVENRKNNSALDGYALVSYRGLWDRLAKPNTVDAFKRAYIKKVPFVADMTFGSIGSDALWNEGLLDQILLPVFVRVNKPCFAHKLMEGRRATDNIYFIHGDADAEGFLCISRMSDDNKFEQCGLYLPFMNFILFRKSGKELDATTRKAETVSLILYESTDVIHNIEEMGIYSHVSDMEILDALVASYGVPKHYIKVSDLVEREFLVSQIEG